MKAAAIWSAAQNKALSANSGIGAARADLDLATRQIRCQLSSLKDVSVWLTLVNSLVQLAAEVATFFA
jgi:hypothetical protein